MDASPQTLLHPERVFNTYNQVGTEARSNLKLIVVLRDPVSREQSFYDFKRTEYLLNQESNAWYSDVVNANNGALMSFEEYSKNVLASQLSDQFWSCDGKYIDHLKQWMSHFRREQMLMLNYVEVRTAPEVAQRRIQEFLEAEFMGHLDEEINQENEGTAAEVPSIARKVLDPLFEKKNLELYRFLDKYPGPPMEQRPFPHFASEPDFTQFKQSKQKEQSETVSEKTTQTTNENGFELPLRDATKTNQDGRAGNTESKESDNDDDDDDDDAVSRSAVAVSDVKVESPNDAAHTKAEAAAAAANKQPKVAATEVEQDAAAVAVDTKAESHVTGANTEMKGTATDVNMKKASAAAASADNKNENGFESPSQHATKTNQIDRAGNTESKESINDDDDDDDDDADAVSRSAVAASDVKVKVANDAVHMKAEAGVAASNEQPKASAMEVEPDVAAVDTEAEGRTTGANIEVKSTAAGVNMKAGSAAAADAAATDDKDDNGFESLPQHATETNRVNTAGNIESEESNDNDNDTDDDVGDDNADDDADSRAEADASNVKA